MSSSPPSALTNDELEVVTDALVERPDWFSLAQTLEKAANERSSFGLRLVSMAFVYDFVPQSQDDRRATAGGPYATMIEDAAGTYPPRGPEVAAEVRTLWRSTLGAVDDPIACARLADLLYVAEGRAAHVEGHRAAECFIELAGEQEWEPIERAECMARALEIFTELNDQPALERCASRAVALVDALLNGEHAGPPFIAIRALLALKPKARPEQLPDVLDRLIARFAGTTHEAAALGLAADATPDQQTKAGFRRRQLEAKVAEGRRAEGIAKVALLSRAIEFARKYGLTARVDELLKELQEMPQSELGLETFETSVDVPTDEIRKEVDRLAGSGAQDAFDALKRIGAGIDPPGGSNSDLDAELDEQQREFPLVGLFGQTILGEESAVPHFTANEESDKRRAARGRQRSLHADFRRPSGNWAAARHRC